MMTYKCKVCGVTGPGERMFNLSRRDTPDGELMPLCLGDAKIAAEKGFRVFRLAATIAYERELETRRCASMQFFEALAARKTTEEARRRPKVRIT